MIMGCLCDASVLPLPEELECQLFEHEYVSAFITKTQKNGQNAGDSILLKEYFPNQNPLVTVEKVSRNNRELALIKLRNKSNYTRMCSNLAFLSIIDATRLETMINNQSVYDNPKIHLPSRNNNNEGYSNEKGHDKVLHLTQHGTFISPHVEYSHYIETNALDGKDLFFHIAESDKDHCNKITNYKVAGKIIKDILYGVKYFHDRNIVHLNIKPENIKFDESSDNLDTNAVLIGYLTSFCLGDPKLRLLNVSKDNKSQVEQEWNKLVIKKHIIGHVGTFLYASPEMVFNLAFAIYRQGGTQTFDDFIEKLSKIYNNSTKEYNLDFSRYNCEKLFGFRTWKERYLKWKEYDTLPIFENDDINKDLWHRYIIKTPRMCKASDIWSVGIVAHTLMTAARSPWQQNLADCNTIYKYMEQILAREYRFPRNHGAHNHKLTNEHLPRTFKVEIRYL